jgi:hypothetical protein
VIGLPEPTRARNLFFVKFAVKQGLLLLAKQAPKLSFLFSGPIGWIIGYFSEKFLYFLVDQGILVINIALMHRRVELEESDYRKAIYDAYVGTKGKVISLDEKKKLRQAVIDTTRKFVNTGRVS